MPRISINAEAVILSITEDYKFLTFLISYTLHSLNINTPRHWTVNYPQEPLHLPPEGTGWPEPIPGGHTQLPLIYTSPKK